MKAILQKIWSCRWVFRNLIQTIYFNLHYLPLKQALHLPIWLYKPHFGKLHGTVVISGATKTGMIRMGFNNVGIYPNSGIYFSNEGHIEFKGTALIGNDCYIHVDKRSQVILGNNFRATAAFRLVSYCGIIFAENVRFGWDCIVMDTDFHKLCKVDGTFTKGFGKIHIGSNNWFANGCRIMKNTSTPNYCTIAAGTRLLSKVNVPERSIIGNKQDISVLVHNVYLNVNDADIVYDIL